MSPSPSQRISKLFGTLHAWLGALLSLAILVLSLSGFVLMAETEIRQLNSTAKKMEHSVSAQQAAKLFRMSEALIGTPDRRLNIDRHEPGLHSISDFRMKTVAVDTRGEIREPLAQPQSRVGYWAHKFHALFFIPFVSQSLLGGIGYATSLLIILGLVAWWRTRKNFSLKRMLPGRTRGSWLASHRNIGIIVAAPIFVISLSGGLLVFPYEFERNEQALRTHGAIEAINSSNTKDLVPYFAWAMKSNPELELRSVRQRDALLDFGLAASPTSLLPTSVWLTFDLETGLLVREYRSYDDPVLFQLNDSTWELHSGDGLRLWYRLVLLITSLAMCVLCVYGLRGFLQRIRPRHNSS